MKSVGDLGAFDAFDAMLEFDPKRNHSATNQGLGRIGRRNDFSRFLLL